MLYTGVAPGGCSRRRPEVLAKGGSSFGPHWGQSVLRGANCTDDRCLAPLVPSPRALGQARSACSCPTLSTDEAELVLCLSPHTLAIVDEVLFPHSVDVICWSTSGSRRHNMELLAYDYAMRSRRPEISWWVLHSPRVSASRSSSRNTTIAATFWLTQGNHDGPLLS